MSHSQIYIVSKGRWNSRLTMKALDSMNTHYYVVVEESELEMYASVIPRHQLLVLPQKYLDDYETMDELGSAKSKGPGAARNYAWDHSIQNGHRKHWVMDDNIDAFHYLNRNIKEEVKTDVIFTAAEDFVNRYDNVPVSGFNYYSFCKTTDKVPPFVHNTRIYSCLLIDNSLDIRWRGRYNEDTDLSLRVLKAGQCTIQFNAFLCGKVTTQRMSGGNTKEFYADEGTLPKSQMLVDMHPDCAKLVWRFNRWHHLVDYSRFKVNEPHRITDEVFPKVNNYGLTLVKRK